MLQAKVKAEYRFGKTLQAFSRHEFIKDEWRDVPAGFEDQAKAHEHLETRERPIVEAGAIETVTPAPIAQADPAEDPTPTAEKVLDAMLEGEPEEVKETRRGRGGARRTQ